MAPRKSSPLRTPFITAALAFLFAGLASAQESYLLRDAGKVREYELAAEMHVVRPAAPAADLKAALESAAPGTVVREAKQGRAFLQTPAAGQPHSFSARAAALSRALPGAQAEAVLYPKDGPRTDFTRRIATPEVLVPVPAGQSAAAIAVAAGASGLREVRVPGYTMLRFSDGVAALDAVREMQGRGLRPEPQLRRQRVLRSTPNDVFFPNQWHLRNTGQSGGVFGIDANITDAWDITKGTGVTIAVVDDSLETTHPDFALNCPPVSSGFHFDFNGGDNDPKPESSRGDAHGTSVGGVAAARGHNSIGVSGGAPEAQLVGIRLISEASTDSEEAQALFWSRPGLDVGVSNNSWGPRTYYAGADTLAKAALRDATITGRGGRGQITLFAGGNSQADSSGARDANADSYAASRYVIAVGALNNFGVQSTYSQRGANLLISAPSSDPFNPQQRLGIWTTDNVGGTGYNPGAGEPPAAIDPERAYTNSFGGTSSASPLCAGAVALVVAATPTLGWRDVHEIVAATATQVDPADPGWVVNEAGFKFNHRYGGGMINATAAVVRGVSWQNLGAEVTRSVAASALPAIIPDNSPTGIVRTFDFSAFPNLRVERVEILLRVLHANRSDLEISLTSPFGTRSLLSERRPRQSGFFDDDRDIEDNGSAWSFTTTHSWGENSAGVWSLQAIDRRSGTAGQLTFATVRIHGTNAVRERVIFEAPAYTVNEADGSVTVRVLRSGDATGAFGLEVITATQGTATATADFTGVTRTLAFAEGQTEQQITVPILQDLTPEAPETIYLALRNPSGVALGGVSLARIVIQDDESRPVIATVGDATGAELPTDSAEIVITRAAADPAPLTVNIAVAGTATNGSDYAATIGGAALASLPSSVTIPALSSSVSLLVRPTDDNFFEGAETVQVTVQPGFDYDVGTQSTAEVSISDNERPTVSIEAATASVPETAPSPVNFVVRRTNADVTPLIVKLQVEGTAQPGDNYIDLPDQVEIPGNAASVAVPLQPLDDTLYIPLKTVVVKVFPSVDYVQSFNSNATINITENDPVPDAARPAVAILSPRNKARINAPTTVVASGTARDNRGVASVFYSVNEGSRKIATGTVTWTADLTADLVPGPNKLSVQSADAEGNLSAPAVVGIFYVQERTLTVALTTNGDANPAGGRVTATFLNPRALEAGQTYTIAAIPAAAYVFAGWSGGVSGLARVLTFRMPDADTTLTAAFISDPFLSGIQGLYTGPVRDSDFAWASAGVLQVSVTARGAASGTISLAGAKLAFRGEFNGLGRMRITLARLRSTPLLLDLTLDLAGAAPRITGTVGSTDFASNAVAERAGFRSALRYAPGLPKAETYTFVIPAAPGAPSTQAPAGTGYGILTIDASGNVKWAATLPDQAVASGGAPLTADLRWVFYASLYAARGLALGEVQIDKAAATTDFTGVFDWLKPANARDRVFPLGFTRGGATLEGSLYRPPARPATETLFKTPATTTGTIDLSNGNITTAAGAPAAIDASFTLGLNHRLTVNGAPPPHSLAVALDPLSGRFSGSFVDAKFPRRTLRTFRGVIVQKQQLGWGGFLGGTISGTLLQTGTVRLDP